MRKVKRFVKCNLCIIIVMLAASCAKTTNDNKEQTSNDDITPVEIKDMITTITPMITPMTEYSGINEQELEEAQKIIDGLMPSYNEMYKLLYLGIETGDEKIIEEENGNMYFVLKNDEYTSVEDIRAVMEAVLTKDCIRDDYNWVLGEDNPKYKNIDGKLCSAMIDGMGSVLQSEVMGIEQILETTMILLMQWETNEGLEDVFVNLKNIDGNWRIDDYKSESYNNH